MPKSHSKKRSLPKKRRTIARPETAEKAEGIKPPSVTGTSSLTVKSTAPLSYPYLGRELVRIAIVAGIVIALLVILALTLS